MKTIILGVGNPILCDDGVGIHVAKKLKQHITDPNVIIDEAFAGGMNLLDLLLGYDKAIIIDAVKTKNAEHGEVRRFSLDDMSSVHSCNPHDVSLVEALRLAEKLGEKRVPHKITVIGVLLKETPCEFGENLSSEIAAAVPKAVDMTLSELENWGNNKLT